MYYIRTAGLEGPIKLKTELAHSTQGDFKFDIDKSRERIADGNASWTIKNRKEMTLFPKTIFDDKIPSKEGKT